MLCQSRSYINSYFISFCIFRDLDANYIEDVPDEAFKRCMSLQLLQLDANQLTRVPTKALQYLKSLHAL